MPNFLPSGDREAEQGKVSAYELDRLIADHGLWLSSDGRDGARIEMPGANLIYGGFSQADLRQAN